MFNPSKPNAERQGRQFVVRRGVARNMDGIVPATPRGIPKGFIEDENSQLMVRRVLQYLYEDKKSFREAVDTMNIILGDSCEKQLFDFWSELERRNGAYDVFLKMDQRDLIRKLLMASHKEYPIGSFKELCELLRLPANLAALARDIAKRVGCKSREGNKKGGEAPKRRRSRAKTDYFREELREYFDQGLTGAEATRKLHEKMGSDTLSVSSVFRWYKQFKEGRTDLEDVVKSGRPQEIDKKKIIDIAGNNPFSSTRKIADATDASQSTVLRVLHNECRYRKPFLEPHFLTGANKKEKVRIASENLKFLRSEANVERVLTQDEKWIFFHNPCNQIVWVVNGDRIPTQVRHNPLGKKAMLSLWFNTKGVVYWELVDGTVTADKMIDQMDKVSVELKK